MPTASRSASTGRSRRASRAGRSSTSTAAASSSAASRPTTGSRAPSPAGPGASSSRSSTGSRPSTATRRRSTTAGRRRAGCARNAAELGIDQEKVGVGGDSVGGASPRFSPGRRATPDTPFAAQLLIYPTISSRQDTPAYSLYQSGYGLTRDSMAWYWQQYIGDYDGGDGRRHLARRPAGPAPPAARDRRHGRGRHPPRRGRGVRPAALPRRDRDRGLPLRRHGPRLPADGRRRRALEHRRSTRSPSRSCRLLEKGWRDDYLVADPLAAVQPGSEPAPDRPASSEPQA